MNYKKAFWSLIGAALLVTFLWAQDSGYFRTIFISNELDIKSGATLDVNGTLDVDGTVNVGGGVNFTKIDSGGSTDLWIITGTDTFVVDSVRSGS